MAKFSYIPHSLLSLPKDPLQDKVGVSQNERPMAGVEVRAARPGSASALATGLTQRGDGGCVEPHDATSEMAAAPASLSNVLPAGGPGVAEDVGGREGSRARVRRDLAGRPTKPHAGQRWEALPPRPFHCRGRCAPRVLRLKRGSQCLL